MPCLSGVPHFKKTELVCEPQKHCLQACRSGWGVGESPGREALLNRHLICGGGAYEEAWSSVLPWAGTAAGSRWQSCTGRLQYSFCPAAGRGEPGLGSEPVLEKKYILSPLVWRQALLACFILRAAPSHAWGANTVMDSELARGSHIFQELLLSLVEGSRPEVKLLPQGTASLWIHLAFAALNREGDRLPVT